MNDAQSGAVAEATGSVAAETTGAGNSSGAGEAASQNGESRTNSAGGSQDSAEGGQSTGVDSGERRNRLMVDRDELLGLRGDRRTLRSKVAELEARLEEIRAEGASRQTPTISQKTEQDFWADANAPFRSLAEKIESLEERVAERVSKNFKELRQQDTVTAQLTQERSEAVKLVHSQPNWDPADDVELVDIIEDYGLGALPPLKGAQAALALFYKQKGVGDKSQTRARAASIVGAPGGASGAKVWPQVEVERLLNIEIDKINSGKPHNSELIAEIKRAQAEGRVR